MNTVSVVDRVIGGGVTQDERLNVSYVSEFAAIE